MPKRIYYSVSTTETTADIYIYGDISSDGEDGATSANKLAQVINRMGVEQINIYINSYGGETSEGIAIYNALSRHQAQVNTYCDGFACSAASLVFMSGENRIMYDSSVLMIHNAWSCAVGDAEEMRQTADALDACSEAAANIYAAKVNISRDELDAMLAAEAWIGAADALTMGFATAIIQTPVASHVSQSARRSVAEKLLAKENVMESKSSQSIDDTEPISTGRKFFNFKK